MFSLFKKYPWLFITLWAIPLIFDIVVGQMAQITDKSYVSHLPVLSDRLIMLGPSIVLASITGLINTLFVLLILNIHAVQRYLWIYAICWTIPFTLASTYSFLMGAGCPNEGSLITHLVYGFQGFFIGGFIAGFGGLILAVVLSIIIEAVCSLTKN